MEPFRGSSSFTSKSCLVMRKLPTFHDKPKITFPKKMAHWNQPWFFGFDTCHCLLLPTLKNFVESKKSGNFSG